MQPTALVTGASTGIGRETARELARRGYRVLLVGRHPERTPAAADEIRRSTGNALVAPFLANFSSLKDVRALAAQIRAEADRLTLLINNAGLWHPKLKISEDGFEDTWAVNHLAPFLLTLELLPLLRESAPARIVNVSSRLHERARPIDFSTTRGEGRYRATEAYRRSKLANVVFTNELARRIDGTDVTANSLHPGDVSTEVMRENFWANLGIRIARPFLMSPEEGAATTLHVAVAPELAGVTGQYFRDCRIAKANPIASDRKLGARLWDVSQEQIGLT